MSNYIKLDPTKTYGIPIRNGVLRIDVSQDENYPGLDIEFVSDTEIPKGEEFTRPRVVIEAPIREGGKQDNLRTLVWANPKSEDYSDDIDFTDEQMR